MREKENVPVGGGAPTGTGQENDLAGVFPCLNCTTTPAKRQVVSEWLGVGEANAKPMRELLQFLNGDSRTIRLQIERERRGGCPILSGPNGYWICGSEDEAIRFLRSMRHRARQTWATARAVEAVVGLPQHKPQQLEGQTELWGGDGG